MASAPISMLSSSSPSSSHLKAFPSPSPNSHRNHRRVSVRMCQKAATSTSLGVQVGDGNGGLPKVSLTSAHGSEADIYLFGGCVTSWKLADGKDLLFIRPDAVFNGKKPISGGIPHCFPQFGPGPMQQHGFGRNMNWSIANSENSEGDPIITLELKDDAYSRSMWDFSFHALYKTYYKNMEHKGELNLVPQQITEGLQVTLHSKSLSTILTITNTDKKPFSFSTALHTYFRASVAGASVKGLKGCATLNKDPDPSNPLEGEEEREVVTFPGFVDCVYLNAPNQLLLDNGLGNVITIKNKNWSDAVLWNPHLQMESCYKDFVCVENAQIGKIELDSEQSWVAEQHISAS